MSLKLGEHSVPSHDHTPITPAQSRALLSSPFRRVVSADVGIVPLDANPLSRSVTELRFLHLCEMSFNFPSLSIHIFVHVCDM